MKKYFIFVVALLCVSFVVADSYELTADKITPGVFQGGNYYFPKTTVFGAGAGTYSGTHSPVTVLSGDGDSSYYYGLYYNDDTLTYPIYVKSTDSSDTYSIYGYAANGVGVYGYAGSDDVSDAAVKAYSLGDAPGLLTSSDKYGVYVDVSPTYGVYVEDSGSYGVFVAGAGSTGVKAYGDSYGGQFSGDTIGIVGTGQSYGGYFTGTDSTYGIGVYASGNQQGVWGVSSSVNSKECGIKGYNTKSGNNAYLGCYNYAIYTPGTALIGSKTYSDLAEYFKGEELEAGDVVVLDAVTKKGVKKTTTEYDKRAAGIISTDPTLVMGKERGIPLSLSGVVPTKVIGKIEIGDLLTTSAVAGHAMACDDYKKCQGAIIGKAMEAQENGKGIITALVMLG